MTVKEKLISFIKNEVVLVIASIAAIITCFFVPIDLEYLNYFDYRTLVCLFCMLAVVAGLKKTNIFDLISRKLISLFHTRRAVIYALVFGTFFFDMIVANDMSLITFLPLTYLVLHYTNNDKYLAITFILQTIAANMGGMITPYGNPQNLYLYSFYEIPTSEFISILLVESIVVALMLFIAGLFIKNEPLKLMQDVKLKIHTKELVIFIVLFILVILTIFRVIPYYITLIITIITILFTNKKTFKYVDYALLATFAVFFVFSGNIARITVVKQVIEQIVEVSTLVAGLVSCQFISNVPTAIFISKFTENYRDLLISVNIGSLGIIISSLASLITLKEFLKHQSKNIWQYLGMFTVVNTLFLLVLLLVNHIV